MCAFVQLCGEIRLACMPAAAPSVRSTQPLQRLFLATVACSFFARSGIRALSLRGLCTDVEFSDLSVLVLAPADEVRSTLAPPPLSVQPLAPTASDRAQPIESSLTARFSYWLIIDAPLLSNFITFRASDSIAIALESIAV